MSDTKPIFTLPPELSNFSDPLRDFHTSYCARTTNSNANEPRANFVVGAYIFFLSKKNPTEPLLLVLHRTAADHFGGKWDFPGGSCEWTDKTVLDSVTREVFEETGLHVSGTPEFVGTRSWYDADPHPRRKWTKFAFVATVTEDDGSRSAASPPEIKLAVNEHQDFDWIGEEEITASLEGKEGAREYIALGEIEVAKEAFRRFRLKL